MTLRERIEGDCTAAQKSGAANRVSVLRLLLAELKNREIEKRSRGEDERLTDPETEEVLRREAKKRREAIALFLRGGRNDLASRDESDIAVIQEYLPARMDRESIALVGRDLIAQGLRDFPSLMKESMKTLKGKADGGEVKAVIESCLKEQ